MGLGITSIIGADVIVIAIGIDTALFIGNTAAVAEFLPIGTLDRYTLAVAQVALLALGTLHGGIHASAAV